MNAISVKHWCLLFLEHGSNRRGSKKNLGSRLPFNRFSMKKFKLFPHNYSIKMLLHLSQFLNLNPVDCRSHYERQVILRFFVGSGNSSFAFRGLRYSHGWRFGSSSVPVICVFFFWFVFGFRFIDISILTCSIPFPRTLFKTMMTKESTDELVPFTG